MKLVNKKKTLQNFLHGQTNSVDNLKVLQQFTCNMKKSTNYFLEFKIAFSYSINCTISVYKYYDKLTNKVE